MVSLLLMEMDTTRRASHRERIPNKRTSTLATVVQRTHVRHCERFANKIANLLECGAVVDAVLLFKTQCILQQDGCVEEQVRKQHASVDGR